MIEQDLGPDTALLPDQAAPAPAFTPTPAPLDFGFSGSGAEYFRIWVVNLLLTVATLGIYSAWAKTRRLQYFYRNTQLAGASFDFRGSPAAILRGRLLAVVVLAAYHYAFGFSVVAGAVTVGLLLAGLPFMMRSALRFRLANTWYRGLPFGFTGGVGGAYRAYLPAVAMFILPGMLAAYMQENPALALVFLLYLCWPLMHGAMKRYQHGHLMYGNLRSVFGLSSAKLAAPYLAAVVTGIAATVVYGMLVYAASSMSKAHPGGMLSMLPVFIGMVLLYLFFIASGLFVMVRMNNMAWSDTGFPGVRIASDMRLRSYLRLQAVNVLFTLFTLGLYRPFAAVRTWRYRLAHVRIEAPDGFESASALAGQRGATAAGDGTADFLGVDLSW
jgi:uncharacterized membrane protein YjgN (DUF898 family)